MGSITFFTTETGGQRVMACRYIDQSAGSMVM